MFTLCALFSLGTWVIAFYQCLCGDLMVGPKHAQLYILTSGHWLLCYRGLSTSLGVLLTDRICHFSSEVQITSGDKNVFLDHQTLLCYMGRCFAGSNSSRKRSFSVCLPLPSVSWMSFQGIMHAYCYPLCFQIPRCHWTTWILLQCVAHFLSQCQIGQKLWNLSLVPSSYFLPSR